VKVKWVKYAGAIAGYAIAVKGFPAFFVRKIEEPLDCHACFHCQEAYSIFMLEALDFVPVRVIVYA
jgi:hypothetical protein